MTKEQTVITILLAVAGTATTRFLPFLLFPEGREVPDYVRYLGRVLGAAVFGGGTHGIPELIALAVTIAVFCRKRKMVLSMAAGTILYMILVQAVF